MRKAGGLAILDENGKKVNFKELISGAGGEEREGGKMIVLVIRHFYCGLCRQLIFSLIPKIHPLISVW